MHFDRQSLFVAVGVTVAAIFGASRIEERVRSHASAKRDSALIGSWAASGVVVHSYVPDEMPDGMTLQRVWAVARRCDLDEACGLVLTRQTYNGTDAVPLTWDGHAFVGDLEKRVGSCVENVAGHVVLRLSLRVDPSKRVVRAREVVHARYPGCGPHASTSYTEGLLDWTAKHHSGGVGAPGSTPVSAA